MERVVNRRTRWAAPYGRFRDCATPYAPPVCLSALDDHSYSYSGNTEGGVTDGDTEALGDDERPDRGVYSAAGRGADQSFLHLQSNAGGDGKHRRADRHRGRCAGAGCAWPVPALSP